MCFLGNGQEGVKMEYLGRHIRILFSGKYPSPLEPAWCTKLRNENIRSYQWLLPPICDSKMVSQQVLLFSGPSLPPFPPLFPLSFPPHSLKQWWNVWSHCCHLSLQPLPNSIGLPPTCPPLTPHLPSFPSSTPIIPVFLYFLSLL